MTSALQRAGLAHRRSDQRACENCGEDFEPINNTQRYCGAACWMGVEVGYIRTTPRRLEAVKDEFVSLVEADPGVIWRILRERLTLGNMGIRRLARQLCVEEGLVRVEQDGTALRFYPADQLATTLADMFTGDEEAE